MKKFNWNKTRSEINDKYQTAKWNARQGVQRTKDAVRAEINRPRKPIKMALDLKGGGYDDRPASRGHRDKISRYLIWSYRY